MTELLKVLYEANSLGIWLWVQDNTLKFKSPEGIDASEIMAKLKEHKIEILNLLKENKVFSDRFLQPKIYRVNTKTSTLSFAQERLWFIEQYEGGTNAYHMPAVFELAAGTNTEGIKYAIQQIVSRHEILRSTIEQGDSQQSLQVVHETSLDIEEVQVAENDDFQNLLKEEINRPFDLSSEYPIRVKIYRIQPRRVILLVNTHHIASDGWSMVIFIRELFAFYKAYLNHDTTFSLPAIEVQYKDYALWQKNYLTGAVLSKQLEYWKKKLGGYQPLELPTDYIRPSQTNYAGSAQVFTLNKNISDSLRGLAQRYGVTLHTVLLSSVNILLSKYTGQDDIVIGSPIANRHHRQTEGLIGFFVNTQANRTLLNKSQTYEGLIQQVHQDQRAAQLHQDLPFERLVDELKVERDLSRHPVFQVLFDVQNFSHDNETIDEQKKYFKPFQGSGNYKIEKFDLSILIKDDQEELKGIISYATSLFCKDTIARLVDHYLYLLDQLTKAPQKPYSQFSLLLPEQYNKIIYQWNETDRDYPRKKTLHELFLEQAEKTPDNIALVYEDQKLTYRELNEKSNQLARHIQRQYKKKTGQDITPDTLIALCLDRSLEMVIGIMAVLKAGGAYVPIDPSYPQERIEYLLTDTQTKLVLSQRRHAESNNIQLPEDNVLYVELSEKLYTETDAADLPSLSSSTDLAYVIYTSGTTGKPKGVMVEHRSVYNTIHDLYDIYGKAVKVTAYTSYVFDVSVSEIFASLLQGLELHILADKIRMDSVALSDYFIDNEINLVYLPPVLLGQLPKRNYPNLKSLIYAGEPCDKHIAQLWAPSVKLYNYYGPTETSIYATCKEIISDEVDQIGRPLQNTKAYVLDSNNAPVPIGATGELYISGAGLARGYLNNKELTAERFIPNAYATEADKANGYTRLYKTGDLVRWLADGNLQYIGRNDDQIKIRGYRIELGEIENALTEIADIKQSCVLAKERKTEAGSTKYLVGYYVLDSNAAYILTPEVILEKLSTVLPDYMIPAALVAMDSFPLTINGKLDKLALPDPDLQTSAQHYVSPTTEKEILLSSLWQEVLGLEKVGVTDDFFKIGGNSILAIQVSHKMSKALGYDVRVADIFKKKTISQLLLQSIGQKQISIPKNETNTSVLSFAQERLWFIEQYERGTNAYHMPAIFELVPTIDIEGIKYAINQIVSRHQILRSTIQQGSNQQGIQVVHEQLLSIDEIQLTDKDDYQALLKKEINHPFDLRSEYPIRVKVFRIQSQDVENVANRTILVVNTHHIANDGWSIGVFQRELLAFYKAYIHHDTTFSLPPLEIQYADYARWQRTYLTGEELANQLNYWKDKLAGYQTLELPTDYIRPSQIDYTGSVQGFTLNKNLSNSLRGLAQQYGATLHSVLLSGLNILLSKYTGQNDIIVGSPIANRHHRQTEELIGFFVNIQVNRTQVDRAQSYEELIQLVHQQQIETQSHQDLPFEKLVDELEVGRDTLRHPVFQVAFVVQNFSHGGKATDEQRKYFKPFQGSVRYEVEKFDLSIFISDNQEELKGHISYATSLFHKDTIARLVNHYIHLLDQLTQSPRKPYSQFSLLLPEEYDKIVYRLNETGQDYPKDKTIYEIFQEQVRKAPDNIALVYEEQKLTYQELHEKSNQLARHLRDQYKKKTKQDLAPDTLIALCLDKSLEMVVAILAVLKAGGAYVPIDPSYPQERIDYLLADTKAALVLTQRGCSENYRIQLPKDKVVYVELSEKLYHETDTANLPSHSRASDLAYVIYTSGTTGAPKGVMIEHASVNNLVFVQRNTVDINSGSKVLQFASLVFDASVWEIFSALCSGAELYIIPTSLRQDAHLVSEYIVGRKITVALLPPVLVGTMSSTVLQDLQTLLVGGDLSSLDLMAKWSKGRRLINAYGPTENTVCATMHHYAEGDSNTNIGRALNNVSLYVLDNTLAPVPIGVTGELYIGGASIARGYLNNKELTAERFITNPFATETDKAKGLTRLYKTGDLVRWLADGNLEYVGRNDDQVKIRGYRIELGEIEHALAQVPGIKQSCVLVKERKTESGSTKYLVGYYVLDRNHVPEKNSDILDSWENLYDSEYEKGIEEKEIEIEADFSGWNSYITAEPIPLPEMRAWRDDIVALIRSLDPENVLEIGVGSGLLMYPLVKDVQRYVGLDISQSVITRHRKYFENQNYNVELYHLKADQLDKLPVDEVFDTIIVNSVCQYFPSIRYFEEMLEKAINRLSKTGSIFLGDIRNYDLHKTLIKEKLEFKGEHYGQHDIDGIFLKENELLISPSYFVDLKNRHKHLRVDVLKREGSYTNELSKYRYDVIISTNIERTIRNQIKISGGESDDFYLTKSINHYNIPFLNQLSKEDILKQLSKVLPDYMVPSTLLTMESFPLTINGKLDKRALPDPGLQASEQHYVAPATETEIELCSLWKKVLELEKVGVTDDFFKIGGNSILAIQVSHKMSKALGCDVRVADIFKHKTIAQLLLHGIGQAQVSIPKSETNTSVLSFAQERLWFIEQYEQGTNAYHMPSVFELTADANLEGIKYALRQIVNRHQILRSTIDHGDDQQGIQVVHEQFLLIDEIQLSDKDDYQTLLKEDINRPFDLKSEYPIRVKFYKIHPQRLEGESVNGRILLLVNTHHIASDGWSIGIFQRELLAFYNAYLNNDSTFSLPALEIQYKDYARWQKTYLTGEVLTNQLNYWKNKIVGYQTLELPTDYARPSQINYTGSVQGFALNKNLSDSLRSLAQGCGVTLHTVLLSGINILLSKYTGQDDIIVGSPIANRHHQQTEGLIGFFVNAQANRTLLSKSQSYEELIQQVHQDQIAAQLHQDLPFEKLVDELKVERDTSRHPVFQVMFDVQSFKQDSRTNDEQGKYFKPFQGSVRYEVEKFDLSIFISDNQEELKGHISYATSLFHKDTIARLVNHYIHLLDQLTQSPRKPYSQFSLLLPEEYDKIVYRLNETGQDYPKDKTIYEIFQEQVRKAPDNIALVYEEQKLTYQELHEKSNQLARHLRDQYKKKTKQDLAPDTLIALCLDKSLEMVVAILAVLKAGGAYVPIDPSYPQERIDYLLADTKAALVLTQRGCSENYRIQLPKDKVVYVELSEKLYHETDTANLPSHSRASDLAYVIYTSGTTGAPKGVMIEHASVNNLVFVQRNTVDINSGSKVLQFASLVFDASVWEIFSALCSGAELYIIPTSLRQDAHLVSEYIVGRKITVALLPPVLVGTMSSTVLQDLQTLLVGGDLSSLDLMAKWSKGRRLINAYGPTENTVCATMHHYAEGDSNTNIGRALNNVSLYVLDNTLAPVPIGVTGELYIGGASIARGYLNNKELTAERFITNPFATETDKAKGLTRLYKTGDLVRWLSDGNLEYVGRNDDQVKIRGYRIELGEIENALAQIAGIEQSCVLAKERKTESGSTKYLVGYYVLDTAKILTQEVIQEKLSTVLPEYMVPTAFVAMDSFPLTINGKLDKRALPDPDVNSGEEGYVAPTTDLEIRLCDIYAEVLGLSGDQIGTHQNFFKIGGNSILTMQLKNKLNQLPEFKHTGVADLFKYNTIHKLIESAQRENETVYKLQPVTRNNNHEVAIIGVSGAFSGANNIDELWQLIANQKEGIHFFSKDECKQLQVDEALLANANYVPVAGKVADIEQFDPLFWGLSPNEAKLLDPQIRKFIEHCWFVLESSGYAQQRKNHNIGVFAGSGNGTYWQKHIVNGESAENIDKWEAMISNNKDALATKTAFLLGLSGPANSINTACSTGLVSVVEACYKLQLGICDMALAGGVSLSMPDQIGYIYKEGMIVSKDGHCRTFDKDASGTTGGSGVGVVLLKRLEDAIKDEDSILGVIKGYATNNDGDRKTGYTAPSVIGQSECIINAQKMAGITPDQIDYIECHGTATHLGDPIEVQALREAFEYNQSKKNNTNHKTILGAVKANIGHTDSAAGTAGLIKVCAMLRHNVIPGQVNFSEPNPEMQLERTNFEILKENRVWLPSVNKQRLAGVSSFGIGGTNAHVIIGDYTPARKNQVNVEEAKEGATRFVIPLSAKSRQSLERNKQALIDYLNETITNHHSISIRDLAYTLQERREHFNYRSACSAGNIDELICKLRLNVLSGQAATEEGNKIVFMFPGQGSQYAHMARELYEQERVFKNILDQCISLAHEHSDIALHEVMYPEGSSSRYDIDETRWTQISLFSIEYSLSKYLEHLGVRADAFIGHSIGEYVAATLCGVFSLEDAIKAVIARGKLMQGMKPGCMLAISAAASSIKAKALEHNCEISVINSPEDVVCSGNEKDIKKLQEAFDEQGIATVILNTSHAYHSRLMDKAAQGLKDVLKDIKLSAPNKEFISNLTGEVASGEVTTVDYWCKQLRNTVHFSDGVSAISQKYNHGVIFIEVGPGKGLSYFVNKFKNKSTHKTLRTLQLLPSLKETQAGEDEFLLKNIRYKEDILSRLWISGIIKKPNDDHLVRSGRLQIGLPVYQFNHHKCWFEKRQRQEAKKLHSIDDSFYERSWERVELNSSPDNSVNLKHKNILLLINEKDVEQSRGVELLDLLNSHCDHAHYAIHQQANDIKPEASFDFANDQHIATILSEKTRHRPIDLVIYHSSSIDLDNPSLDIFAVRNIFGWAKITGNKIPKFISTSFDNYEVLGNERLQEKPSIVYGVTKSIRFEYFTSETKTFHIDLTLQDSNYKRYLLDAFSENDHEDLIAIRGKYQWFPTYRHVKLPGERNQNLQSKGSVYLITGGLGGVGYGYANYLSQQSDRCTLILIGRSSESQLREDYKTRLSDLRKSHHNILYAALDIGHKDAPAKLKKLLFDNNITSLDAVLHSAGVAAKSAMYEKTVNDIEQVVDPKIGGLESLIKLSKLVRINLLVNCSSLSSIQPSLGNLEYTAANLYLDEVSYRNHSAIRNMLTINLNQISDTGMAFDFLEGSRSALSLNSISSQEFPSILERIIQTKERKNIVLSRYSIDINSYANVRSSASQNGFVENDNKIKITDESYTEIEYRLAQIVGGVLGVDEISIHDDFFMIGGNSILAIRVSHKMSKELSCDVRVADIFKHKTIAKFLLHSLGQTQVSIPRNETNASVLSFAQERLWFIEQYEEGTNAYHIPLVFELAANTDIEGTKYAIRQIVYRHEILRSTIEQGDNQQGIQIVQEGPLSIEEVHVTDKDNYQALLTEDINRPFDLRSEYPIRVKFYKINSQGWEGGSVAGRTLLLVNMHHIASDGWSIGTFQRELFAFYKAYLDNNTSFSLPALEIQYKDYARWQRTYLTGEVLANQLNYWKNKLAGYQSLELPTDFARPSQIDYTGSIQGFTLNKNISDSLRALAQCYGVTLHTMLLSSINILLSKYTGQEDIVVGSPIANRHHHQTEGLIGFFVNTQVNRTQLSKSQNYEELIHQVHQGQIAAQLHQDLPFEKLVDELKVERDTSRHPVFQVMFDVQSFQQDSGTTDEQRKYFKPFQGSSGYKIEKFDLSISVNDGLGELEGYISYATSLFHKDTIVRLINHFKHLLEQLILSPQKPYSQFSLLLPEEYNKIVYQWNATDKDYKNEKTICELFQAQVEKTPDTIALVLQEAQLTYKEVNEKSNQLARHLRKLYKQRAGQEMKPDTLIALCLNRSLEMVIGILAVLKAGGAYVPIDPAYPQERIDYLLADTQTGLVLTQRQCSGNNKMKSLQDKLVYIELTEELYHGTDTADLPSYNSTTNLAYVIYTSGTTGNPKGVMITQKSVVNYVNNVSEVFLADVNNIDFSTNLAFDLTITTTLCSLLLGKKIFIYSGELSNTDQYVDHLIKNKIDFIKSTPSLLSSLATDYFSDFKIKQAFIGGEKLENFQLAHILKYVNHPVDEYGPTEATVGTCHAIKNTSAKQHDGIGKPYFNYKTYVLDSNNTPVPIGVIGELYIGGEGLAEGYLNNKELTMERFVTNPFATESDKAKGYVRLYKTGDLVRWRADGNLEYIGRNDSQVKIRGYRIELGEIEYALAQIKGIKQNCVIALERKTEAGSTKYLAGYYVLDSGEQNTPTQEVIREKLSLLLPDYMVPAALIAMESFPLTVNGKLDKRALPDPDFSFSLDEYVAPINETERAIVKIWQEVLGLKRVGVMDNFFRIGGNSILAIQLSHKMSKALGCDVKVADVFKLQNVKHLLQNAVPSEVGDVNVIWKF